MTDLGVADERDGDGEFASRAAGEEPRARPAVRDEAERLEQLPLAGARRVRGHALQLRDEKRSTCTHGSGELWRPWRPALWAAETCLSASDLAQGGSVPDCTMGVQWVREGCTQGPGWCRDVGKLGKRNRNMPDQPMPRVKNSCVYVCVCVCVCV